MAGIVFKREPFFKGADNNDQLDKIVKVLGTENLQNYLRKYNIVLDSVFDNILGTYKHKPWYKFVTAENSHFATESALDLLEKMLVMDHCGRITAAEAMKHPYFDDVKDIVGAELM